MTNNNKTKKIILFMEWTNVKPVITQECAFATASLFQGQWEYRVWSMILTEGEDDDNNDCYYLALCDEDGDEWGDYEDLTADMYFILPPIKTELTSTTPSISNTVTNTEEK